MSLTNSKSFLITLGVLIVLLFSVYLFFPGVIESIITGLAGIDTFSVSLSVTHADFDINNRAQLDSVVVNGTNITIVIPVNYYGDLVMNLSLDKPQNFECGFDWYINESGDIKSVSANVTALSWEANKSVKNTSLYFEVSPPTIISEITYTGDSYYEKTMVINSCAPLMDVMVNTSVSTNYQDYVLYLIENNTLINRTAEYNLQVSNGTATFSGFNISDNKTFRIQAAPNATIVQQIIQTEDGGGGGGGGGGMPLLNYTPTQAFLVEPNYISITTSISGASEEHITIYNLRGTEKSFNISFTTNFIYDMITTLTLLHKESAIIPVYIDTTSLEPGNYTDYIYVRSGNDEEQVTVDLKFRAAEGEEEVLPTEEQPVLIPELEKEEKEEEGIIGRKPDLLATLIIVAGGMLLMGMVVILHLRKARTK